MTKSDHTLSDAGISIINKTFLWTARPTSTQMRTEIVQFGYCPPIAPRTGPLWYRLLPQQNALQPFSIASLHFVKPRPRLPDYVASPHWCCVADIFDYFLTLPFPAALLVTKSALKQHVFPISCVSKSLSITHWRSTATRDPFFRIELNCSGLAPSTMRKNEFLYFSFSAFSIAQYGLYQGSTNKELLSRLIQKVEWRNGLEPDGYEPPITDWRCLLVQN